MHIFVRNWYSVVCVCSLLLDNKQVFSRFLFWGWVAKRKRRAEFGIFTYTAGLFPIYMHIYVQYIYCCMCDFFGSWLAWKCPVTKCSHHSKGLYSLARIVLCKHATTYTYSGHVCMYIICRYIPLGFLGYIVTLCILRFLLPRRPQDEQPPLKTYLW